MRNPSIAVALLLSCLVPNSDAEMPRYGDLAQRRYIAGMGIMWSGDERSFTAESRSGIWDWDWSIGMARRIRPLSTYIMWGDYLDANVSAVEDRYIVQHRTMLEFDAATNRFLRSYPALAPEHGGWVHDAAAIDETTAARLGIESGYYGGLTCPAYDPGPSCWGDIPGIGEFGVHDRPSFIVRRSLDPADTRLDLVHAFDRPYDRLSIALDTRRGRIWFVGLTYAPGPALPAEWIIGYIPIEATGPGAPTLIESHTDSGTTRPDFVVYDGPTDSILISRGGWTTRQPADLSAPPQSAMALLPLRPSRYASLSGRLPDLYEQIIPAVGNGPGAFGTYWRSDVWIFNPSGSTVKFNLRRVSSPKIFEYELPARGSLELQDALLQLGGGPVAHGGDGVSNDALVITSPYRWGEQLTAYSRTYTASQSGAGTYGQAVPAVPGRLGYSNDGTFILDVRRPGQFRHNVGVVNDSDAPLEVTFEGAASETITVLPRNVANVNIDHLPLAAPAGYDVHPVRVRTSRPAPVWLSMVDNTTGDATFVPFASFSLGGALDASIAIPQIAATRGAFGTRWRSDLYGVFESEPAVDFAETSLVLRSAFHPAAEVLCEGRRRVTEKVPVSGRWFIGDIASRFTGCSGDLMGALELYAGSWTTGYSRTYTTREDGGTLGDILPMYPIGGWPVQHFSGISIRDNFRINLGLYNGLDYPVVDRLLVYDAAGTEVARRDFTLESRRSVQMALSNFVGELPPGLYGMTVLPLDAPDRPGRSWAYVSIIDNATGDPTNLW